MRPRRYGDLVLALLVSLLPLAGLATGLLWLGESGRRHVLTRATPTPASSGWREWDRGLATWYDGPTEVMRNGEKLDLAGLTCAVDASVWEDLKGRSVRVRPQGQAEGGAILRVTDSGYLKAAGRFMWDPLRRRYIASLWPGYGQYVVVDIPRDTHQRLFGGRTAAVILEVHEGAPPPAAEE